MAASTDHVKDDGGGGEEPEYEDIIGDCTLLVKRVLINKNISPNIGERVTIRWKREIPELGKTFPEEDLTFTLGDGDVEQALELIVSLMKLGEKFTVIAGFQYMYGEFGQEPDVPSKANFKFDVELLSNAGIVDYPNMDVDTRFNEAKKKKERGNILFRRRDYPQALNLYQTACKIVDRDLGFDYPNAAPEKLQEVQEFRAVILCNTSVAQIKLQLYDAAVLSAREASKLRPSYSKAFYRLGQAHDKRGQTQETITAYKKALQLHEGDGKPKLSSSEVNLLQSELERLAEKKQQSKIMEKQMYSRMFGTDTPAGASKNSGTDKSSDKSKGSIEKGGTTVETTEHDSGNQHDQLACAYLTPSSSSQTAGPLNELSANPDSFAMFAAGMKAAQQNLAAKAMEEDTVAMGTAIQPPMDPGLLWKLSQQVATHIPNLEEELLEFRQSLAAGMKGEEAAAMATTFLMQLGMDCQTQDPVQLLQLSKQIASLIPENIRDHLEEITEKLAKEAVDKDRMDAEVLIKEAADVDEKGRVKKSNVNSDTDKELNRAGSSDGDNKAKNADGLAKETYKSTKVKRRPTTDMISFWEKKIQDHIFSPEVRAAREELLQKHDENRESNVAARPKTTLMSKIRDMIGLYEPPLAHADQNIEREPEVLHVVKKGKLDDLQRDVTEDTKAAAAAADVNDARDEVATSKKEEPAEQGTLDDLQTEVVEDTTYAAASIDFSAATDDVTAFKSKMQDMIGLCETPLEHQDQMTEVGPEKPSERRKLNDLLKEIIEDSTSAKASACMNGVTTELTAPMFKVRDMKELFEMPLKHADQEIDRGPGKSVQGLQRKPSTVVNDATDENAWLWTAGYTVIGLGAIGLAVFGIYRYTKK